VQVVFAISRGAAACAENVFFKKQKSKNRKIEIVKMKKSKEQKIPESLERVKTLARIKKPRSEDRAPRSTASHRFPMSRKNAKPRSMRLTSTVPPMKRRHPSG
jgi:hypothetical protein